jgi:hypothetical protein
MTENKMTHLAVLKDGTLRLVRSDSVGGPIEEVAALAVDDHASLDDVMSACVVLTEMSAVLLQEGRTNGSTPPSAAPAPKATPATAKKAPARRKRSRVKGATETRFDRDDILIIVGAHNETGGLRTNEIARMICRSLGIDYHHDHPVARAVGNRVSALAKDGRLTKVADGRYVRTAEESSGDANVAEDSVALDELSEHPSPSGTTSAV